jgi:hypothetical protein
MTAPAKNAPKNDVKANNTPVEPVKNDVVDTTSVVETPKDRIPKVLSDNAILADFCKQYMGVVDEIAAYNKEVLAEKSSEWNAGKVLEKAREFARPTDKSKADDSVKSALDAFENLVNELAKARKNVLDVTSKKLGITLSATSDRNPEIEGPLKDKRKFASEIGSQLFQMSKFISDGATGDAVTSFLADNPLPAIGREQARSFGSDGTTTPKYRVTVKVVNKDGEEILNEDGFTKTALALTKPVFGYERGQALKADKLREVWEKAGNSGDATTQPVVEFTDNDLHFTITKK